MCDFLPNIGTFDNTIGNLLAGYYKIRIFKLRELLQTGKDEVTKVPLLSLVGALAKYLHMT